MRLRSILLACLFLISGGGRGGDGVTAAEGTLSRLVVVDDKAYPPFAFLDSQGTPRGITVDIWDLWSKRTGIPVEFRLMDWDAALEAVQQGQADAVGGLFLTPEREPLFDFTSVIVQIPSSIFFHEQISGIKGFEDLAGFRVGVVQGDSAEETIRSHYPQIQLFIYPGMDALVRAAVAGEIKVFVGDVPSVQYYLAQAPSGEKFRQATGGRIINKQCSAVRKGNTETLQILQSGFDRISRSEIDAIVEAWAGRSVLGRVSWHEIGVGAGILLLIIGMVLLWNLQLRRQVSRVTRAIEEEHRQTVEAWKAIKEGERNYHTMFDMASIGIVQSDSRTGQWIRVNRKMCDITGYSSEEMLRMRVADITHPSDRQRDWEAFQRVARGDVSSYRIEKRYIRKDRTEVWVNVNVAVIRDADGQPIRMVATIEDINERKRAEEARQAAEQRLADIIEFLPDPTFVIDGDKRVVAWNHACEVLTGVGKEVLLGQGDYVYAESLVGERRPILIDLLDSPSPEVEKHYKYVMRKEDKVYAESFVQRLHGGQGAHLWGVASPLYDREGHRCGAIEVMRDVTEQKMAELALRESERRYVQAISATSDAIWEWNLVTGETFYTPRWYEMLGYQDHEIEMKIDAWKNLCHPDDLQPTLERIQVILDDPGSSGYEAEFRMRTRSGEWRWIQGRGNVVKRDAQGNPIVLSGTNTDITPRRQAEAERERLLAAIEQSGEIIAVTDAAGTIEYVNPAFEAATGYTRVEVIGKNLRILKSGEQDAEFYRNLWETISNGKTWRGRFVNKRKDGMLYTEEAVISPVRDKAGTITNYVCAKNDISASLKMESELRQAQKMESVGRLAGGVAHDFNNMLSVILGHTDLALERVDPVHPIYGDLIEIQKATERSANLTRQLLAFARKQTVVPRVLDLNETLSSMLKMLQRLIGENIRLDWLPGEGLWPVLMDPSQIDQILANLCVNARDAIADVGHLTIETRNCTIDEDYCASHAYVEAGEYVCLSVSDSGCGMDREILSHIFEPFFTTKSAGQGTGLGLATVYGIVKQNNGFINVYSEPGQGSAFSIYLPRHEGVTDKAWVENAVGEILCGNETILLVEDEVAISELCGVMLERLGYTVLIANTPGDGVRLAREFAGQIHLLITDVVMPEMNGRDLARNLLALYPRLKCLFMSGYTADVVVHRDVLDEGGHFLPKPFSLKDLASKVRQALEG